MQVPHRICRRALRRGQVECVKDVGNAWTVWGQRAQRAQHLFFHECRNVVAARNKERSAHFRGRSGDAARHFPATLESRVDLLQQLVSVSATPSHTVPQEACGTQWPMRHRVSTSSVCLVEKIRTVATAQMSSALRSPLVVMCVSMRTYSWKYFDAAER